MIKIITSDTGYINTNISLQISYPFTNIVNESEEELKESVKYYGTTSTTGLQPETSLALRRGVISLNNEGSMS